MKAMTILMLAALALTGCKEKVLCGAGTMAVPVGVDTSATGYSITFDGNEYVDASGNEFKEVHCEAAVPVIACSTNLTVRPAVAGETTQTDGSGYYVKHDGSGLFVKHDAPASVQADQVCDLSEPAPVEQAPTTQSGTPTP